MKRLVVLTLLALFCITGCSDDIKHEELKRYVESIKSKPHREIGPPPKIKQHKPYSYSAMNMRSPFERPMLNKVGSGMKPDETRIREPLESIPLDTLKMVGTIYRDNKFWGIIAAPDGNVYSVMSGSYIGRNYGRVVNVEKDGLEIVETVRRNDDWVERPITIPIVQNE